MATEPVFSTHYIPSGQMKGPSDNSAPPGLFQALILKARKVVLHVVVTIDRPVHHALGVILGKRDLVAAGECRQGEHDILPSWCSWLLQP